MRGVRLGREGAWEADKESQTVRQIMIWDIINQRIITHSCVHLWNEISTNSYVYSCKNTTLNSIDAFLWPDGNKRWWQWFMFSLFVSDKSVYQPAYQQSVAPVIRADTVWLNKISLWPDGGTLWRLVRKTSVGQSAVLFSDGSRSFKKDFFLFFAWQPES